MFVQTAMLSKKLQQLHFMTYTGPSTVYLLSALEHNICQMSHVMADAGFICHEPAVLWGKIRRTSVTMNSITPKCPI